MTVNLFVSDSLLWYTNSRKKAQTVSNNLLYVIMQLKIYRKKDDLNTAH